MSPSRPRTVLVTGGAGFVGAAVVRALLRDGTRVIAVDDLSAGHIDRLEDHGRLERHLVDVRDVAEVRSLLTDGPPIDTLVHLAARVGVRTVLADPDGCAAQNVDGVTALIEALRSTPLERRPRLLAASSSEVYADSEQPLGEGAPLRVEAEGRWAYAASKRAGEALLDAQAGLWPAGQAPLHLRFFNVVGPGQDAVSGMVLPRFVEAARVGHAIEVHGDGGQVRTFAHVEDVAADVAQLASATVPGGALNLGGTARASILELAQTVALGAERHGWARPQIRRVDPHRVVAPGFRDVRHRVPDLSRALDFGLARRARSLTAIVDDMLKRHTPGAGPETSAWPGHFGVDHVVRVARVLTRLNLGGPARQVLASDPLLVERGIHVRVFTGRSEPGEGDLMETLQERGIEVVRIPSLGRALRPLGDWRATRDLSRALIAFVPDVVHTHASKAGLVGRRAARSRPLHARTVHTFHGHVLEGYFPPATSWLMARVEERLAKRTDRVLAVSKATADDLARLGVVARDRIRICPPGIDLEPFLALEPPEPLGPESLQAGKSVEGEALRREFGIPLRSPVVLVLGRLAPIKRPELALEIFARAAPEVPEAHLILVGDGVIRPLLETRRERLPVAVRSRVHFAGPRLDMPGVLAAADILLATSRNEGLPVAMIEAAAAARPVVSTAVGGVAEVVRNGVTGLLAAEKDGLVEALLSLLIDPLTRQRMGLAARSHVTEVHSARALADRLEAVYRSLLEGEP